MINFDRQMKSARIAPGDPDLAWKQQVFTALEFTLPPEGKVDLYDLSGIATPTAAQIAAAEAEGEMILRDPVLVMRHWAFAESVRKFGADNSGGDLVNFRIFFNMPKNRGWSNEEFKHRVLPQLADLAEFVAGVPAESLQVNRVSDDTNHAFVLIRLAGNIVAEIECHDQLPEQLEPMRFIHAYYQHGAISNLPLAGFLNMEGIMVATNDGETLRQVTEDNHFDSFDEVKNFFYRAVWSLRNREIQQPIFTSQEAWRKCFDAAWNTFNPVEVIR